MGWIPYINSSDKHLLILDAGHGIDTPGKRAEHVFGTFYEWVFNRHIVDFAIEEARLQSINVINLVPEDEDLPINTKHIDTRVKRIADIKSKYPLSVNRMYVESVHGNAAGVESARGFEVFTSPIRNLSDDIATVRYEFAKQLGLKMRSDWSDGDPDKEAKFAILTGSPVWAILSEYGFYTNPDEARLMSTPDFQRQVAKNIIATAKEVFNIILK